MPRCTHPLALATLALATTAQAQPAPAPSVTLYGVLDLAVYQKQLAGEARNRQVISGGMTTSYWGLRGSEELGGGLRALFDISGFLRADTGETGRSGADSFWGRMAWVGLQDASLGTLRAGRQTSAAFINTIRYNPFGDSASFSPTFLHVYLASATQPTMTGSGASDSAWNNVVSYTTPGWGGFAATLALAPSEAGPAGRRAALSGAYTAGPFSAGLALEKIDRMALSFSKPPAVLPMSERRSVNAGASYDLGPATLYGQFVRTRLDNASTRITLQTTQLGAAVPVGDGRVLASWARTSQEQTALADTTRQTVALGYDHFLSKRTDLYAVLLADRLTGRDSGTGLALGMRHRF
ncbi:MAG TPA: porin [Ideonella sp.]|nr:porin [Ideonella sp.]